MLTLTIKLGHIPFTPFTYNINLNFIGKSVLYIQYIIYIAKW